MSRGAVIVMLASAIASAPWPCLGGNLGLASGVYGATLGAGAAAAAERCAWGQSPAAFRPGEAGFLLHVHRPFGLEEIRVAEAGGFWDFRRTGLGISWRQTAVEDLFSEHGFEGQVSRRLGGGPGADFPGSLDLGGAWSLWRRATAGRAAEAAGAQGYGLVWHLLPRLRAGVQARGLPLAGPRGLRERVSGAMDGSEAAWQWGFEAGSGRQPPGGDFPDQSLRFDFRRTGRSDWRMLAGLSIRPHPSAEFTAGLASAPFQFSLGLRMAWSGFEIHQAYRQHRHLGATWLSSLGYARTRS